MKVNKEDVEKIKKIVDNVRQDISEGRSIRGFRNGYCDLLDLINQGETDNG